MSIVRRCLGCSATYPPDEHACPECGSHAAELQEQKKTGAAKPTPKRKT